MKRLKLGPLQVTAAGGSDREGGGDGPAVVLCHGYGAPGDDLVSLARVIDAGRELRWFFPEAPLELDLGFGMAGRAWWNIDMMRLQEAMMRGQARLLAGETPVGMDEARAALEACLGEIAARFGVARERLVLGGFSQGAMVATEIALHAEQPFAGLALLSGTLLSEDRWRAAAPRTAPTLDVLMSHGRADPLLPFEGAEALRALLEGAGARVTWVPHGGGHELPAVVLDRLGAFLRERLSP
jgi:phospholipase/carboxylesterase